MGEQAAAGQLLEEAAPSAPVNPFVEFTRNSSGRSTKFCIFQVLKDAPQGLTLKTICEEITARSLREFGKNPSGQVTAARLLADGPGNTSAFCPTYIRTLSTSNFGPCSNRTWPKARQAFVACRSRAI